VDSATVAEWGAPTFDAWIVRTDFAEKNPAAVSGFVKVTGDAYADFLKAPEAWSTSSEQAAKIAKLTGAKVEDVPLLLKGYVFPPLADQASEKFLGGATVQAVAATSEFLKEQGKIDAVLPDYGKYVSAKYVSEAAASN
jgi:taurine transport system substrate-binding protein